MQSPFGIATRGIDCERLDLALTREPFSLSRREAKRVIAGHRVTINGRLVAQESRRVSAAARVALLSAELPLKIVYEDDEIFVVDKPVLLPTQPSPDDPNPSLVELLASIASRRGDGLRETYVVHRLDTNTTGIVVAGKTPEAAADYAALISSGDSTKRYVAICEGRVPEAVTVNAPIGRVSGNLFGVLDSGKSAVSIVTPIDVRDDASLVWVEIRTGRTHQIRVHLTHIGHSVVGDTKYGRGREIADARRPMLHAAVLRVADSRWIAPLPEDLIAAAERLGLRVPDRAILAE